MTVTGIDTISVLSTADETRAESAPVLCRYESLDADGMKTAFAELNAVLHGLADQVVLTIDQITPHLAEMQSLLSQRGKARNKALKLAGLPKWSEYAKQYAQKLECSMRTLQDHITGLRRNGKSGPSQSTSNGQQSKRNGGTKRSKPWHADAKDSRALADAQIAINDMVTAYEAGADLEPAYTQYKKVAVSPTKLNVIFEAANPESDKAGGDAEVQRRLVTVVETAERYIRALETLVHSSTVIFTEDEKKTLQKPMWEWRGVLRFARGVKVELTGVGVSVEDMPVVLKEVA